MLSKKFPFPIVKDGLLLVCLFNCLCCYRLFCLLSAVSLMILGWGLNSYKKRGFNRVYPHLLRHTFATNFIYRGGNLEVLRVLMGHANINITQIYIHLAEQKDN